MTLSNKDQEVLSRIFNPSLFIPIESEESIEIINDSSVESQLPLSEVKKLEIEAIKLAEQQTQDSISAALDLINQAIQMTTDSSLYSLLNNKAQILRLMKRNDEALACLNQILGAEDGNTVITKMVVRQASAQRGWLLFRSARNEEALADFERASRLGCLESKRMAVRCNPYAAMCNQMMQELIGSQFYSK